MDIKPVEKNPLIRWATFYSLIMLLLVTWQTSVAAQILSYTIDGGEKLKVRRCCPRDEEFILLDINVDRGNRTWEAEDDEGNGYTGTYRDISSSGREVSLKFDQISRATLKEVIKNWAEVLLGKPVNIRSFTYFFKFEVNENLTRGELIGRAKMRGRSGGKTWTIVYRVRAEGPET